MGSQDRTLTPSDGNGDRRRRRRDPSVGVLAVGRPTFDLDSAASMAASAAAVLRSHHPEAIGDDTVHTTAAEVEAAVGAWGRPVDTLVILCATFTDSTLPAAALDRLTERGPVEVVLWSFPEPRIDDRLRLNSLCGAILAAFRLRSASIPVRSVHGDPEDPSAAGRLRAALDTDPVPEPPGSGAVEPSAGGRAESGAGRGIDDEVDRVVTAMARARVGVIGQPPDGFEPCRIEVDPAPIGARFDHVDLPSLFAAAEPGRPETGPATPVTLGPMVAGLVGVREREPVALDRSLRLHDGLRRLATDRRWDAVAVRCWPECFTEWGGAACAPLSFLSESGIPSACEADGYGALTCLLLQTVAGRPTFLSDLVDIDRDANTMALWHCGVAPTSLADPARPMAAIDHPNRRIPLALHFGLAPGAVTLARISQSAGRLRLFIGFGEIVDGPPPFLGTSGTVRLRTPVDRVVERIVGEGLEHHVALVPGDHRRLLTEVAARWRIPVVTLAD